MNENNQLEKQEIKRPWQANALVVSGIVFILARIFVSLSLSRANSMGMYDYETFIMKFIISQLSFVVFGFILVISFLKKHVWSLQITMFIFSFYLFNNVLTISRYLSYLDSFIIFLASLLLQGCIIYLSISCLKHPFYNQKKVK